MLVNRPDQLDWSRVSSAQNIAWKTGTSYGARDGWAIGVTPKYVVGVWVGNADGSGVADLTGARTAGPIMFDIFNMLPACGWFDTPKGKVEKVCAHSGMFAGKYCAETISQTVSKNAVKSKRCSYCTQIPVSIDRQRQVSDASEPSIMTSYFQLPPIHKHYYKQNHAEYVEPPANHEADESNLKFIYPTNGAVILLPRKADGTKAELICKAAHSNPSVELFWHLDNNFVVSTTDIHQIQIAPSSGVHKLTIYDNNGLTQTIEIIIEASSIADTHLF